jgi:hypothetical protein
MINRSPLNVNCLDRFALRPMLNFSGRRVADEYDA